jgi:hypothetical protein
MRPYTTYGICAHVLKWFTARNVENVCSRADTYQLGYENFSSEQNRIGRIASSGMLRRVALLRTDISEELRASFIRVTSDLVFLRSVRRLPVTASVIPTSPILVTLMKEALSSSEMSVLTRAVRRNIPEDAILHSHRRENLKSYRTEFLICNSNCKLSRRLLIG